MSILLWAAMSCVAQVDKREIARTTVMIKNEAIHAKGVKYPVGSGIVVSANQDEFYVLSCAHCFWHPDWKAKEDKIQIIVHDGKIYPGTLLGYDDIVDLALIKVPFKSDVLPARLAKHDLYRSGTQVLKAGHSSGPLKIEGGTCIGLRRIENVWGKMISLETSIIVAPGDSGGGLYRESDGCLIGVVWGTLPQSSIVIRLDDVRRFLAVRKIR